MFPLPRRSHPRYQVHKLVSYRYEDRSVLTLTVDLGLRGMKIKTQDPLPKDKCLKFKLVLGADSIWPMGRIAYSRFLSDGQTVSGVHFMEISKKDEVSLKNYLGTLGENSYELPSCVASSSKTSS